MDIHNKEDKLYAKLLIACKNRNKIYCYGAGHFGSVVRNFLEINKISVKSYIVSNYDGEDPEKVLLWENVSSDDLRDSLVILSLSEKHHDFIRSMVINKCREAEIFPITTKLFESLPMEAHNMGLVEHICRRVSVRHGNTAQYEDRISTILNKYQQITLKFFNNDRIGTISLNWIYYNVIKNSSDVYLLFFPLNYNLVINPFLDKKIKSNCYEGIEVICDENIDFWQYALKHYKDKIIVDASLRDVGYFYNINCQLASIKKSGHIHFIDFSSDEEKVGDDFLHFIKAQDFVLVFARDSKYTKKLIGLNREEDRIFDKYRNLSINSFSLMAEFLKSKSISTLRFGSMPEDDAPYPIIDYGMNYRSDFLDVFLSSRCRYFVGTPSGVQHIADLFGKFMVIVNVPVLTTENNFGFVGGKENLMILQKYWDSKKQRFLTLREMLQHEMYGKSEYDPNSPRRTMWIYHKNDIIPVKNTQEEILAVIKEMEERLSGEDNYDTLDIHLQNRYEKILREYYDNRHSFFNYRIGRDFIRNNQWLLE